MVKPEIPIANHFSSLKIYNKKKKKSLTLIWIYPEASCRVCALTIHTIYRALLTCSRELRQEGAEKRERRKTSSIRDQTCGSKKTFPLCSVAGRGSMWPKDEPSDDCGLSLTQTQAARSLASQSSSPSHCVHGEASWVLPTFKRRLPTPHRNRLHCNVHFT